MRNITGGVALLAVVACAQNPAVSPPTESDCAHAGLGVPSYRVTTEGNELAMCLPATWKPVAGSTGIGTWVREAALGELRASAVARTVQGEAAPTLVETLPVLPSGEVVIGCSDCIVVRQLVTQSRQLGGRRADVETAFVSGGFDHRPEVPTALVRWRLTPTTWLVLTVEDPELSNPAHLLRIVESTVVTW